MVHLIAFDGNGADSGIHGADPGSVKQTLTKQISCFSGEPAGAAVVCAGVIWASFIPSCIRITGNKLFLRNKHLGEVNFSHLLLLFFT